MYGMSDAKCDSTPRPSASQGVIYVLWARRGATDAKNSRRSAIVHAPEELLNSDNLNHPRCSVQLFVQRFYRHVSNTLLVVTAHASCCSVEF